MKFRLVDLIDKLEWRPVRVQDVKASGSTLQLALQGVPWWDPESQNEDENFVVLFTGVSEATLELIEVLTLSGDEFFEDFNMQELAEQPWATVDVSYSIYGSEPLPRPLELVAKVADFLSKIRAPRTADDYLNASTLSAFCEHTQANAYLIAHAPPAVSRIITEELNRQSVRHSAISFNRPVRRSYFVRIGRSTLICDEAYVQTLPLE